MSYGFHDGDIISLDNHKAGALTMSVDFQNYRENSPFSPETMWRSQTAIRSVVGFKVASIASIPFHLFTRDDSDGRTRVREGALAQALGTPGNRLGQARFLEQLQLDMAIYGRWAFIVGDTEDGKGYEFMPLPAHRIAIVVDGKGRYTELALSTERGWVTKSLDDVVFDISRGPTGGGNKRFGYSDLETLTDLAAELSGMAQYRRDLFLNSAMVPAVIERPANAGKWSDEAWTRFKAEISNYRAGGGKAGGWPILEDGMQLKPVTVFDPKSAQYVEVRELHLKEAAQALHIPPELVGAVEGTHSNIIALREQLYVDVLGTDIKYFEDALNAGLKHLLKPGQYIEANLDSKLRGTLAERAKIYNTSVGGPWMSRAEARSKENLPYLEGTDEIIVPLNVVEGGQASPADSAPDDNGQDIKDTKLARTKAVEFNPKARFAGVNKATTAMETAMRTWYDGFAKGLIDRMGLDQDLEADTAKAIAQPSKPGKPKEPKLFKPAPTREELRNDQDILTGVILQGSQEVALATGVMVAGNYGGEIVPNFHKTDNYLAKAAATNAGQFLDYYHQSYLTPGSSTGLALLGDILQVGLAQFETFSMVQSTTAHSFAARDMAKQLDMDTKTWWTTSKNPRESHKAVNGETVASDEYFSNDCRYPGDWDGGAAEVLNCQCRIDYTGKSPYEFTE